jgi:HK97 family phage portal protein
MGLAQLVADTFSRGHVLGEGDEEFLLGGNRTAAGERVSEKTAMKVAAVYSCISIIESSVRLMPLHVRQDTGDRILRDDRESRLWSLLHDRPNPEMHAADLWEWVSRCLMLRGNGFGWLQRGPLGTVDAIWPLHPRRVNVVRDRRTRRKMFEVSAPDDLERVEFYGTTDEIIHFKGAGGNALEGESVIQAQRETIGRALREDRHASETLRNHARPGGILRVKGRLDTEPRERLAKQWKAAHGGNKVGGTAVLEEDTEWQKVTMTAADLELVKQRAISREDIAIAFKVPGDMVLAGSSANLHYSSDASRDVRLVKYGVMPWADRIQSGLEICDMLPWRHGMPIGRRVPRFNPAALLRADEKTRFEAYKLGVDGFWLDPNEPRRIENLEPIDGLDKPIPRPDKPAPEKRGGDL